MAVAPAGRATGRKIPVDTLCDLVGPKGEHYSNKPGAGLVNSRRANFQAGRSGRALIG